MTPHSLRLRLILVSALTIVVSLTVAGFVLTALFADHIGRATVRSLTDDLNRLAALVDMDDTGLRLTQPMSDPRFDVPYGGIYWQVRDPAAGTVIRSRSMWDKAFDSAELHLSAASPSSASITDPEGTRAIAVGRLLSFETAGGARPLELIVAEDNTGSEAAIAAYRIELFRALLALAALLVLAAWAQVSIGLSPLNAVRRGISAIRAGEARSLVGRFPAEVQPLVAEVNDLAQAQELAIQFARERAADLAHGLKTYLQVLNAEAHQLRIKGEAEAADSIEKLTSEMAETIDHQLGLTRLRRRAPRLAAGSDLGEAADRIIRTVRKTTRGAELGWLIDIAPRIVVGLDGPDLSELLGALLENAAKWAGSQVRVTGVMLGSLCEILIEDDGPGMTDAQIARLGERGVRIDELRSGSGIGVSIVREIVALNEGELRFSRSPLGGLAATVRLPATAAR